MIKKMSIRKGSNKSCISIEPYLFSACFLASILIVFLCVPPASGQEVLQVAFNINPPWKTEQNGVCDGVEAVLTQEIAKNLNAQVEFRILPFKRGLYEMEHGQIDMMSGVLKTPEREAFLYFIEPPYKSRSDKAFYVLKGKRNLIRSYDDLYKLTIGTELESKYFPEFDRDEKLKKDIVSDVELNIKKLLRGRIDTFIATASHGDYLLHKMGVDDKIEQAEFAYRSENPVYFCLAEKSVWSGRKDRIEKVIREMIESGTADRLITGYFTEHHLPVPAYK